MLAEDLHALHDHLQLDPQKQVSCLEQDRWTWIEITTNNISCVVIISVHVVLSVVVVLELSNIRQNWKEDPVVAWSHKVSRSNPTSLLQQHCRVCTNAGLSTWSNVLRKAIESPKSNSLSPVTRCGENMKMPSKLNHPFLPPNRCCRTRNLASTF